MNEFERKLYYKRKYKILKMRRKISSARKDIRKLRMLIRVSLIAGIIFFSYKVLTLSMWRLNPDDILNMNPSVVQIEGNLITPKNKIADIVRTADIPSEQIFKFNTKQLEDEISELQSVKKAYVRRFWFPARLIVFIDEVTPVFVIAPNVDSMPISAVTKEGKFIGREYMPIPSKFKTVKILSYGNQDNYEKWDKKRIEDILKFIKTVEVYSKEKVQYLDFRNKNDVYVKLDNELLRVGIFDDTTKDRIKWIPTILPEAKNLRQKVKYIDLRWKDAYYIKYEDKETQPKQEEKPQE